MAAKTKSWCTNAEKISRRNRFVKRPVPRIEADLRRGGGADYKNRADSEECKTLSSGGKPNGNDEFAELMNKIVYPFVNRRSIKLGLLPRYFVPRHNRRRLSQRRLACQVQVHAR